MPKKKEKSQKGLDIWPGESYDVGAIFMKLMGIKEYRETRYTKYSRPSEKQIIKLIREGTLPGIKQGKFYYIDIDKETNITGDALVDAILN